MWAREEIHDTPWSEMKYGNGGFLFAAMERDDSASVGTPPPTRGNSAMGCDVSASDDTPAGRSEVFLLVSRAFSACSSLSMREVR